MPARQPFYPSVRALQLQAATLSPSVSQAGAPWFCVIGRAGLSQTSSTRHLPTWKVEIESSPWQAVGLQVPRQWRRPCGSSCRTVRRRAGPGFGSGSLCRARRLRTPSAASHKVFGSGRGHSPTPGPPVVRYRPGPRVSPGMCTSLPVCVWGTPGINCWDLSSVLTRPGLLSSSGTLHAMVRADSSSLCPELKTHLGDKPPLKERGGWGREKGS